MSLLRKCLLLCVLLIAFLGLSISDASDTVYWAFLIVVLNLVTMHVVSKHRIIRLNNIYLIISFLIPWVLLFLGLTARTYNEQDIAAAGVTLALYSTVLQLCITFFQPAKANRKPLIHGNLDINNRKVAFLTIMVSLTFAYRYSIGALGMTGDFEGDNRFLNLALFLSEFYFFPVLVFGVYYLKNPSGYRKIGTAVIVLFFLTVAFTSGSRLQVIFVLALVYLIMSHNQLARWTIPAIFLPIVLAIFPFMMLYRGNGFDLFLAYDVFFGTNVDLFYIFEDLLLDRFNNFRSLVMVSSDSLSLPYDGSKYLDNIRGLIPRFIWPEKPLIGMDLNMMGHQLGLISPSDRGTSIVLTPIGEGYVLLGFLGCLLAIIQFFIMVLIERVGLANDVISRAFYILLMVNFTLLGTYLYILPTLINYGLLYGLVNVFGRLSLGKLYGKAS